MPRFVSCRAARNAKPDHSLRAARQKDQGAQHRVSGLAPPLHRAHPPPLSHRLTRTVHEDGVSHACRTSLTSRLRCVVQGKGRSFFRTCSLKLLGTSLRLDAEMATFLFSRISFLIVCERFVRPRSFSKQQSGRYTARPYRGRLEHGASFPIFSSSSINATGSGGRYSFPCTSTVWPAS
jgi:hypothetical protein